MQEKGSAKKALKGNYSTGEGLKGNDSTGECSTENDSTVIVNSATVSLIFILIMNIKLKTAESSRVSYIHVYKYVYACFQTAEGCHAVPSMLFNTAIAEVVFSECFIVIMTLHANQFLEGSHMPTQLMQHAVLYDSNIIKALLVYSTASFSYYYCIIVGILLQPYRNSESHFHYNN